MSSDDLARTIEALGQPSWWDYFVGAATIFAALASIAVAIAATHIAWKAETGRKSAETRLQQERAESRLRDAVRELIVALHDHVGQLNVWATEKPARADDTNAKLEEYHLRLNAIDRMFDFGPSPRPDFQPLRGALDTVLLAATASSGGSISTLDALVLSNVVAPEWHAAAQHLTDISRALARWSGRDDAVPTLDQELEAIRLFAADQYQHAQSLAGTAGPSVKPSGDQ